MVIGPGSVYLIGKFVRDLRYFASLTKTDFSLFISPNTTGTLASYRFLILTIFLFLKSTPLKCSINVVTKCCLVCSPSPMIDKPEFI
jgi:hypothetical protein